MFVCNGASPGLDTVVELRRKAVLVEVVVSVECLEPELRDVLDVVLVENVDAVGRPKQTVPDHQVLELLKGLLPGFVVVERPFK